MAKNLSTLNLQCKSVNNHILDSERELRYICFQEFFKLVIQAGENCVILKRNSQKRHEICLSEYPSSPHSLVAIRFYLMEEVL